MDQPIAAAYLLLRSVACCIAAIIPISAAAQTAQSAAAAPPHVRDPLAGNVLYDDVRHYESFGVHRYGTAGARAALDWLAGRLLAAGLSVEQQRFSMDRQYLLEQATMTI